MKKHFSTAYTDEFTLEEINQQIRRLQAEIEERRAQADVLQDEVYELERELDGFTERYDRVLHALNRLEAVKKAIAELEHQRRLRAMMRDTPRARRRQWEPPAGYVPVEEQVQRNAARQHRYSPPDAAAPDADPAVEDMLRQTTAEPLDLDAELKRLYRKLARRWHPDLATDEADTQRRTEIMAIINTAYENRELETLLSLDDDTDSAAATALLPLALLRLRQLQQTHRDLARRIEALKQEQFDLMHNSLMDIKIESALAAAQGRDLLQEIIDRTDQEYWVCMARLDELQKDGH